MRFVVDSYDYHNDAHNCVDESGGVVRIDLLTAGNLGKCDSKLDNMKQRTDLIGKTVEIERVIMYVGIGHGVKLIEEENGKD